MRPINPSNPPRSVSFSNLVVFSWRYTAFAIAIAIAGWMATSAVAWADPNEGSEQKWTRFRGENGVGRIATCNVPLPWTEEDVAWSRELPGIGNGSPVVHDGKIYLQSADQETAKQYVQAFDLVSGEPLWTRSYEGSPYRLHTRSTFASATPCVSDKAVFVAWASRESLMLKALTHAGEEIWSKDLGPFVSQWGFGGSPTLIGDTLIFFNSQAGEQLPPDVTPGSSRIMAFDPATGEKKWERPVTTTRACYGVPTHFRTEDGQDALLFANTGDGIFAVDLASGEMLWNNKVFDMRCVSCPVVIQDLAIGTQGSGGGGNRLFAVDLHGDHQVRFSIDRAAPYVPTPVATEDHLYLWSDNGIVSCFRVSDQQTVWRKRVGGNVSTSPVIAGDKLIGIAEDGTLTILAASEEFREFGSISLGDVCRATPLVAEDYMLVRTHSKLMCIGKPE